jgi:hypothetical protein
MGCSVNDFIVNDFIADDFIADDFILHLIIAALDHRGQDRRTARGTNVFEEDSSLRAGGKSFQVCHG